MSATRRQRPKRSSSQNVDYSLKHRKIIVSEDSNNSTVNKKTRLVNNDKNGSDKYDDIKPSMDDQKLPVRRPLNRTDSKGEIVGINAGYKNIGIDSRDNINDISVNDNMCGLNKGRKPSNTPFSTTHSSNTINSSHSFSPELNRIGEHTSTDNTNCNSLMPWVHDVINEATGLPLSQFPTEKIKRERLWNYKKVAFSSSDIAGTGNIKSLSSSNLQKKNDSVLLFASPITLLEPIEGNQSKKKFSKDRNPSNPNSYDGTKLILSTRSKSLSPLLSNNSINMNHTQNDMNAIEETEQKYKAKLKTNKSDYLTHQSYLRHVIDDDDINSSEAINIKRKPSNLHQIVSKPLSSKNKLFTGDSSKSLTTKTQIDTKIKQKNNNHNDNAVSDIENDDFCSSCGQTGTFLCCDTCPKSFHFLCLDPPMDPNNLPEGDWSCPNCIFKAKYSTQTKYRQGELEFVKDRAAEGKGKLFSKMLFKLQSYNPKQFNLTQSIKDTFEDVKTGPYNEYNDKTFKTPLTEKQLFNTSYGQSITKLDSYCPEIHYSTNDENPDKFLTCYKCRTTRFGSWDHPEESRLLIKCDYCQTPWHLDCIPNIPRASLKNLGYKWKCPLHTNTLKQRRLSKKQPFLRPSQTFGFKNDGDIEIMLDEILASKDRDNKRIGDLDPIPIIEESSIKVDFIDKIFNYKRLQRDTAIRSEERLIDKLINNYENQNVHDVASLVYFNYCNKNKRNEKLWNLRELCHLANSELATDSKGLEFDNKEQMEENNSIMLTSQDIKELLMIKQLIQSKPKEEIKAFFDLK